MNHQRKDTYYTVNFRCAPSHPQPPHVRLRSLLKIAIRSLGLECTSVRPGIARPPPPSLVYELEPATAPPAPSHTVYARVSQPAGSATVAHWIEPPGLAELMSGLPTPSVQLRAAGAFELSGQTGQLRPPASTTPATGRQDTL